MADTLLIGLGNPILGDDGVGWKVVEEINNHPFNDVEIDYLAVGGLALMERVLGYEHVILVDAVQTGAVSGMVHCWTLEELPNLTGGHTASTHDTSLQTALDVAKSLGAEVPSKITVIGIEAQQVTEFSEELSSKIAAAIPGAVAVAIALIQSTTDNPMSESKEAA